LTPTQLETPTHTYQEGDDIQAFTCFHSVMPEKSSPAIVITGGMTTHMCI